jgi:hypothetical protein
MTRVNAPYAAGDKVKILHSVQGATVLGVLPIDRVVALSDGKSWRLEMTRNDPEFPMVSAVVGVNGRDKHGYVERLVPAVASCGDEFMWQRDAEDHEMTCGACTGARELVTP